MACGDGGRPGDATPYSEWTKSPAICALDRDRRWEAAGLKYLPLSQIRIGKQAKAAVLNNLIVR